MKSLFFLLFLCIQILDSKGCFTEERTALLHFKAFLYNQTDYYGHRPTPDLLPSWIHDPSSDCCRWNRVTCDSFSGHVIKLHLQDFSFNLYNVSMDLSLFQTFKELRSLNLSNSYGYMCSVIHAEVLANLSNLEVLSMKDNNLVGPLPVEGLCSLEKIRVLDLSHNSFNGPLPACFGNLTSLQALDLTSNYLSGEMPKSVFANLGSLEYLSLAFNDFEGSFPLSSLANNSQLKVLTLGSETNDKMLQVDIEGEGDVPWVPSFQLEVLLFMSCKLNTPRGTLPSFLLYQHELLYLDLSNNNLVGQFPNWLLVNNTKLKSLILHNNSFTGLFELWQDMGQHPDHSLNILDLSHNKIAGKLPQDIGHIFQNLEYLYLSYNELYGTIPTSVGSMFKLIVLDLSKNSFSGEVPKILWTGCASLRQLTLSDNSLSGQLFPSPLNLSNLEYLFLQNNYFSGTLQHGILPSIIVLDISNNKLWGTIPYFVGNLSNLEVISLSRNNFTGTLPKELCKPGLYCLHLSYNKLSGSIPPCYLNSHLNSLTLQSNSLVGSIPKLRIGVSMRSLDLRDNKLSGKIPGWADDKVRNMRALLLGGNHLQGQLPNSLCQLEKINFLDLSRNNFTGSIPACFSNFTFGEYAYVMVYYPSRITPSETSYQYRHLRLEFFSPDYNYYEKMMSSAIKVEFRTKGSLLRYEGEILRFMSGLDLSCNQLTGLIPYEMGYLAFLHALNLSHNHLNGTIPESFHNLEDVESLDLSYNNLSGEIPSQLQDLNSLEVFNVSYNNLSGTVPDKGQLGTFDESSFIGNPYLCWNNSNRGITRQPPPTTGSYDGEDDDSVIDFTFFYWSFVGSYVTVLLLFVTILWINPHWRRLWFYFIETCLLKCFHRFLKDAFY